MTPELEKALTLAYNILGRQALSEKKLKERLIKKKLSQDTIDLVLEELKSTGLVSDKILSENMAESRVKGRLMGNFKIVHDLISRGIPKDQAQKAVQEAASDPDAPSQEEKAYLLIQKRIKQIRAKDDFTMKRQLFGYLARRGFDPETIKSALDRYGSEAS